MNVTVLVTRPEHDAANRYLSKWTEKLIKEISRRGITVIDLYGGRAVRKEVIGILEKRKPQLALLNGHGSASVVAGHDDEVVLQLGDKKAVEEKIIYARACKSAKELGPDAVAQGAKAYLGYDEDFVLMFNIDKLSKPLEDRTAALFLEPSNHVVASLLKGHSAGEANKRSRALYRKNIAKLLVDRSSEDYDGIRLLYWDMIHQVCIGDQAATA
ncbi:MAG: hypothetical protein ACRD1X_20375 [Vicinamibacteria bacterium]